MTTKVYLASSFDLIHWVKKTYNFLKESGFSVPDIWWDEDLKEFHNNKLDFYGCPSVHRMANRHFKSIRETDAFVIVCPYDGRTKKFNGANVELGYALALGKPCFSVGNLEISAMYKDVTECENISYLLHKLKELHKQLELTSYKRIRK